MRAELRQSWRRRSSCGVSSERLAGTPDHDARTCPSASSSKVSGSLATSYVRATDCCASIECRRREVQRAGHRRCAVGTVEIDSQHRACRSSARGRRARRRTRGRARTSWPRNAAPWVRRGTPTGAGCGRRCPSAQNQGRRYRAREARQTRARRWSRRSPQPSMKRSTPFGALESSVLRCTWQPRCHGNVPKTGGFASPPFGGFAFFSRVHRCLGLAMLSNQRASRCQTLAVRHISRRRPQPLLIAAARGPPNRRPGRHGRR